jgi:hypothetical protein
MITSDGSIHRRSSLEEDRGGKASRPQVAPARRALVRVREAVLASAAAMRGLHSAALVVGLCLSGAQALAADRPTVMVLYFDNNAGGPAYEGLAKGLADMMMTDLAAVLASHRQARQELRRAGDDADPAGAGQDPGLARTDRGGHRQATGRARCPSQVGRVQGHRGVAA